MTGASQVWSFAFHADPGPAQATDREPSPGVKLNKTGVAVALPQTAPAVTVLLTGCHVAGSVQNQVFAFTIVYGWPSCGSVPDGYREGTGTGITSSPHAARASAIDGGGGGGAAGAPGVAAGGLQNATHAALAGSGGQPNGNDGLVATLPGKNGLLLVPAPPW